ncbi:MAG: type II toxin-antitoxin system prevent-host-death family antitoxin [Sphingobacteriales bacterium]|nr:MAG: type II toxin-antitoxin system prevent-host-death family antitoxin [Sphingobacteriales bacterium]
MLAANYTEFRTDLKKMLDKVENDNETLVVKRGAGKGAVIISLSEYNALMETVHILKSKANADRLFESIQQMKDGKTVENDLIGE